jgi:hypothetical protein
MVTLSHGVTAPAASITGDEVRKLRDKIADRGAAIQANRRPACMPVRLSRRREPHRGIPGRCHQEEGDARMDGLAAALMTHNTRLP